MIFIYYYITEIVYLEFINQSTAFELVGKQEVNEINDDDALCVYLQIKKI